MAEQFQISRDSPALFITAVTKDRLPVFRKDAVKQVVCEALNEARNSGGFLIFAYVIMLDHLHLLTSEPKSSADVLRYVKGIIGRRVIDYLKNNNHQLSLAKLQHQEWKRKHQYSVWQVEKNVFSIFSEPMFMQKVNYIHMNPVRAGLVERAVDYRWSSARIWHGCPLEDEPLRVDMDKIRWRRA
ncbi:MAG TPA: transposase [Pyrinomonadaceae bacterium]|nr:transposase [Pyrinomonadaceae bacterium]